MTDTIFPDFKLSKYYNWNTDMFYEKESLFYKNEFQTNVDPAADSSGSLRAPVALLKASCGVMGCRFQSNV